MGLLININGEQHGPYELPQIQEMLTAGQITQESMAWQEGMADWAPIHTIVDLSTLTTAASPTEISPVSNTEDASDLIDCPFCGEQIKNVAKKCKHCGEFLDGRKEAAPAQPAAQSPNVVIIQQAKWNRGVAIILSFFIPGAGQLYKGQIFNGIFWFIITVIGYFLFIIPGIILHICCLIGASMGDPNK